MGNQEKSYRIGLFGHYGQNNLGDEAVILSTVQNLRDRFPHIELVGFSMNPIDTHERYNIKSFPVRCNYDNHTEPKSRASTTNSKEKESGLSRLNKYIKNLIPRKTKLTIIGFFGLLRHLRSEIHFLSEVKKQLKDIDTLIICGSGQFEDFAGPWGYPYTILKWVMLAKAADAKVFIVSIGAGPPTHSLSYWMYKKILTRADYVSYRDQWSKQVIESRLSETKGFVYPDLAHSLKINPDHKNGQKVRKTLAINPMPAFDKILMKGGKQTKYDAYINNMAELILHALNKGFSINLFNSHTSDLHVIDVLKRKTGELFNGNLDDVKVISNETVQDLMGTISEADLVVATRFHSTTLPLLLGKPVIGLCYHTKSKEILKNVGLGDYYVDIYEFTGQELCQKFDLLCSDMKNVTEELKFKYGSYQKSINEQWDRLADMIRN